jgi:hypothetical protein
MKFTGDFETHISVQIDAPIDRDRLQRWCVDRNLKFLHIMLDRGEHKSQPMLTRRGRGDFDEQLQIANNLAEALGGEGFAVTRIKLEAAPGNHDVPSTDEDALTYHPNRYFEHHIKLAIASTIDLLPLTELTHSHWAHLSRNALQIRDDGCQERFVTQRCMNVGRIEAENRLQMLVKTIESLGYHPIDLEAEFVVYDSNLTLDRGWL